MLVRAAWNLDVEQSVVLNAWRKSGIFGPPQTESTEQEEDTLPTSEEIAEISEMAELEDQLDVDAIIDSYLKENEKRMPRTMINILSPPPPPTATECIRMLSSIENKFLASTVEISDSVTHLRTRLAQLPQTQAPITKFLPSARC